MTKFKLLAPTFLASVGLLFAVGCDSEPVPVPTTGTVTVGGQPAEGALVRLWPVEEAEREEDIVRPVAHAGADGAFSLTTYSAGDGAPVGKYKVTVEWRPVRKTSMEPEGDDKLAGKYADPKASTMEVTVAAPSTQLAPIALDAIASE